MDIKVWLLDSLYSKEELIPLRRERRNEKTDASLVGVASIMSSLLRWVLVVRRLRWNPHRRCYCVGSEHERWCDLLYCLRHNDRSHAWQFVVLDERTKSFDSYRNGGAYAKSIWSVHRVRSRVRWSPSFLSISLAFCRSYLAGIPFDALDEEERWFRLGMRQTQTVWVWSQTHQTVWV